MPCYTMTAADEDRIAEERERLLVRSQAILCGIFTALEKHETVFKKILNEVNWDEVGVTRKDALAWFKKHKARDAARKEAEALEAKRARAKKRALEKLSPRERKLLGVK